MAAAPKTLIENPERSRESPWSTQDGLSQLLRSVRFSGAVHFCLMPCGDWRIDAGASMKRMGLAPGRFVPFHIVAEGPCWLKTGERHDTLHAGDVVAFPSATPHELGVGDNGPLLEPVSGLPPIPWSSIPVLRYGDGSHGARVLCGYVDCSAFLSGPLRASLPEVLLATSRGENGEWLRSTIAQIEREVDRFGAGSSVVLERLTETLLVEVLRQHVEVAARDGRGWLAALSDPILGRCIAAIHAEPHRDWTLELLASAAAGSRSVLAERFQRHLGISPMRYLRDWRLHLANLALTESNTSVATIACQAGYASEAAFSRAFSRAYGKPPAAWRRACQ